MSIRLRHSLAFSLVLTGALSLAPGRVVAQQPGQSPVWSSSVREGMKQALLSRKQMLLYFYAPDVAACQTAEKLFEDDSVKQALAGYSPVKVNVRDVPATARVYQANDDSQLPRVLIIGLDDKVLARFTAGGSPSDFVAQLKQHAAQPAAADSPLGKVAAAAGSIGALTGMANASPSAPSASTTPAPALGLDGLQTQASRQLTTLQNQAAQTAQNVGGTIQQNANDLTRQAEQKLNDAKSSANAAIESTTTQVNGSLGQATTQVEKTMNATSQALSAYGLGGFATGMNGTPAAPQGTATNAGKTVDAVGPALMAAASSRPSQADPATIAQVPGLPTNPSGYSIDGIVPPNFGVPQMPAAQTPGATAPYAAPQYSVPQLPAAQSPTTQIATPQFPAAQYTTPSYAAPQMTMPQVALPQNAALPTTPGTVAAPAYAGPAAYAGLALPGTQRPSPSAGSNAPYGAAVQSGAPVSLGSSAPVMQPPRSSSEVANARAGLGLEGQCPVSLIESKSWKQGDLQYGAVHRGKTYLFAGAEQQAKFLSAPDRYSPVLSGYDPVVLFNRGEYAEGKRQYGGIYNGRLYLFATADSAAEFRADTKRFEQAVYAAEVANGRIKR